MRQQEPSRMRSGYVKYATWTVLPRVDKIWIEVATEGEGTSLNVHVNAKRLNIFLEGEFKGYGWFL